MFPNRVEAFRAAVSGRNVQFPRVALDLLRNHIELRRRYRFVGVEGLVAVDVTVVEAAEGREVRHRDRPYRDHASDTYGM